MSIGRWDEWNGRLDWVINTGVVILIEYLDGAIYRHAAHLLGQGPMSFNLRWTLLTGYFEAPRIVLAQGRRRCTNYSHVIQRPNSNTSA